MEHGTTILFGLPGLGVRGVEVEEDGTRVVHAITADETAAACPSCGVFSTSLKQNRTTRPKDVPYGEAPLAVRWHKRRLRCVERACARKTFTETIGEVPLGARLTGRLRRAMATAVGEDNRSVSEVARAYGVRWPTAHRAFVAAADAALGEPAPTRVLGIDETRRGRPRWEQDRETGTWLLVDRWHTGFVDLAGPGGLLGQVVGRRARNVTGWLAERPEAFRDAVEFVAIDPCAAYAAGVRAALPQAQLVVDHFHLVKLANDTVTTVRRRVTWENRGRRGRKVDSEWTNRRRLLTARERLSGQRFARMWNECLDADPSGQIISAWIAKEELRALLATAARGGHRSEIAHRKYRFGAWCAAIDVPEVTTLAETMETWWPEIEAFCRTRITNAGTEGINRLIKDVGRRACGFRNPENHRRRVRFHCTRRSRRNPVLEGPLPPES
jgi:transposase